MPSILSAPAADDPAAAIGIVGVVLYILLLPPILALIVYGGPLVLLARMIGREKGARSAGIAYLAFLAALLATAPSWCRDLSHFIAIHIPWSVPALGAEYGALLTASVGAAFTCFIARGLGSSDRPASQRFGSEDFARLGPDPDRAGSTGHARFTAGGSRRLTERVPRMELWCDVLGVPETANLDEIKTAYRSLAMRWHPDRVRSRTPATQRRAEKRMRAINAAYEAAKRSVTA